MYESRAIGADAILLIVAALPDDELLTDLHALAVASSASRCSWRPTTPPRSSAPCAPGAEILGDQQPRPRHVQGGPRRRRRPGRAHAGVGDRRRRVGGALARGRRPARCRRVRRGARRRSARPRRRSCRVGARPRGRAGESEVVMDTRFVLAQDQIPTAWYNALPDLPEPLQPPLHPGTKEPVGPDDLAPLFPMALIEQEMTGAPTIDIPGAGARHPAAVAPDAAGACPPARSTRSARPRASTTRTSRCRPRARTSPTPRSRRRTTTRSRARARLATETGAGQWGIGARVRLRAVRPRVQGLHGARVVRPEAVPARC